MINDATNVARKIEKGKRPHIDFHVDSRQHVDAFIMT